jgi:hypothetical protein
VVAGVLAVVALPAAYQLWQLIRILASRLGYPSDVHFAEGATLLHVHRLLHGQTIYPPVTPDAGFLGEPYPPVLYLVIAGFGAIFGFDYVTARAVAVGATAAGAGLLAHQVYRQFRELPAPWFWSMATLGAIAAAFPLTVAWYDAPMCDPLALAFAIAVGALLATRRPLGTRGLTLAVVLMVATIFTKQNYAAFVAWLLLFLAGSNWKKALIAAGATGAATAALYALLQSLTGGAFGHYVVSQLLRHMFISERLWGGTLHVLRVAPYLPLLAALVAWLAFKRRLSGPALLWFGMLLAAFPVGLVPYAKVGGGDNNLLPILVLAPAAAACVLADLCRWLGPRAQLAVVFTCALGSAGYLLVRRYPARPYLATPERHAAAVELNRFVARIDGDVLIPARPLLAIRNGSRVEQIHLMAYYDVVLNGRLDVTLDAFVRRIRPRYVFLSDQEPGMLIESLASEYYLKGMMPEATWPAQTLELPFDHKGWGAADYPGQLRWILERNAEEPGARCLFDFESTSYGSWVATGTAFGAGPTPIASLRAKSFLGAGAGGGVVGRSFASSKASPRGDLAVGVLTSPAFVIDRPWLSFRFASGASPATRVEILVDGRVRHSAHGRGHNYLEHLEFRMEAERGRSAVIKVLDEAPNAHAMIDHVCLGDRPAAPLPR